LDHGARCPAYRINHHYQCGISWQKAQKTFRKENRK
jgi:hypothetical protein